MFQILTELTFEQTIRNFQGQPITRQLLPDLLKDYRRPYDKINELIKSGDMVPVNRGIFIPGSKLGMASPEPLLLANHLLGPAMSACNPPCPIGA